MRKILFLIVCLIVSLPTVNNFAAEKRVFNKLTSRKFGNASIVVHQRLPKSKHISGKLPSRQAAEQAAKKFYAALASLPELFIRRSGLRYVTFLEAPMLRGVPVGGVASGNTIYLSVNFSDQTVYHELFHIFDPLRESKSWQNLNNKKFVYTGSIYYAAKLSRQKRKRKDQNVSEKKYNADFVSTYAMSNEREDRAETFAAMVSQKEHFLKRAAASPVLRKKMKFIINMTDNRKLLGKNFWIRNFKVKDLSQL